MVGVCICEHHGRAGLADVCIHIHEAVSTGSRMSDVFSASFRMGNFNNREGAEIVFTLNYCRKCATTHGLPTHNCEFPEANWEGLENKSQFTGVCGECLKDLISD